MAQSSVTPPAPGTPLPPPASDINVTRLVLMTIAVLAASALAFTVMTWLINLYTAVTPDLILPGNIRNLNAKVTFDDIKNRDEFIQSSRQTLRTYGWLDKDKGIIRIPIDQAIELTAQRGLPSRPNPPATSQDQVPGQYFSGDTNSGRAVQGLKK